MARMESTTVYLPTDMLDKLKAASLLTGHSMAHLIRSFIASGLGLEQPAETNTQYRWSVVWKACRDCGGTEYKHFGRGLCQSCYERMRRMNQPERYFARIEHKELHAHLRPDAMKHKPSSV